MLMTIHFYLRFSTHFGQAIYISGNNDLLGNNDITKAFPIQYLNDQLWHGSINIDKIKDANTIQYKYILREQGKEETIEFGNDRIAALDNINTDEIVFFDTWNYSGEIENAYFTQAFQDVLLKLPIGATKVAEKVSKIYFFIRF